jgi:hypothetical protein
MISWLQGNSFTAVPGRAPLPRYLLKLQKKTLTGFNMLSKRSDVSLLR